MTERVITFGSATVDTFIQSHDERSVSLRTDEGFEDYIAYPSGEKILIKEPHEDIGGGGTNTAACFAKLGIPVGYAGAVGLDVHGDKVMRYLAASGVEFLGARVNTLTNMSIVLDSHKLHDRTIFVYKGASDALVIDDLELERLGATWWYFSSLLGASYQTMLRLMRYAHKHGIALAFNPSGYQAQQGLDALREPITLCQLLVLNRDEAGLLVGEGSREECCRRLRGVGAEIVLVTDGGAGATLLYADMLYSASPTPGVEVVETTGAGDCFASSFLAGLMKGLGPEQSFRLAFVNSESLVGAVGPKNGLLSWELASERVALDTRVVSQSKL